MTEEITTMLSRIAYVAVRRASDDGHVFCNLEEVQPLAEMAETAAASAANRNRSWHRANPVIRVAKIRIEEIEESE